MRLSISKGVPSFSSLGWEVTLLEPAVSPCFISFDSAASEVTFEPVGAPFTAETFEPGNLINSQPLKEKKNARVGAKVLSKRADGDFIRIEGSKF